MRRQKIACCAMLAMGLLLFARQACAAENFYVRTFVPTFGGSTSLGANVSTILALRLWTTLRPRPVPNPDNLYFGVGQIEWSRRVIEDDPDEAVRGAIATKSHMALWGSAEGYGSGVIVTAGLVLPPEQAATAGRQRWIVRVGNVGLELGLPNVSYQFSPLIISREVLARYSRPNQVRFCKTKILECDGPIVRHPFRAIRIEGDFILVWQSNGVTGWAPLPNLSAAEGEVVDFTAGLISYLRGDFEQAGAFFAKVRDSKAESLVRNDAALLAGISNVRRGRGIDALRMAHEQNRYSRFGVQALVMAYIELAASLRRGELREAWIGEARTLLDSYRHIFQSGDAWLANADRALRALN